MLTEEALLPLEALRILIAYRDQLAFRKFRVGRGVLLTHPRPDGRSALWTQAHHRISLTLILAGRPPRCHLRSPPRMPTYARIVRKLISGCQRPGSVAPTRVASGLGVR